MLSWPTVTARLLLTAAACTRLRPTLALSSSPFSSFSASSTCPAMASSPILSSEPLGFPYPTVDPFLFCVYHKDQYPAGDAKMQAPRRGDGADFDWSRPYRMYHGDRVPGFPQHPHRGIETITATMDGLVDHSDSLGNMGRYGMGDLQWMNAGRGLCHGEMFPLVNDKADNPTRFFQIWLNLPAKDKMCEPGFVMHWAPDVPKVELDDGRAKVTVFAGAFGEAASKAPPPKSWAANPDNDVGVFHITLEPGARLSLPPSALAAKCNRVAYFFEGAAVVVGDRRFAVHRAVTLDAAQPCELHNPSAAGSAQILVLQGRPIGEPVVKYGPFVMNTQDEIQQAFRDYQQTRFGGWPYEEDAVVFPRDKGRFARLDGKETFPPGKDGTKPLER